jgi:hypothetical protein
LIKDIDRQVLINNLDLIGNRLILCRFKAQNEIGCRKTQQQGDRQGFTSIYLKNSLTPYCKLCGPTFKIPLLILLIEGLLVIPVLS